MTLANSNTKKKVKIKTHITIKKPLTKKNIIGLTKTAGRNNSGKITIKHKGNGSKNKYRKIDFSRTKFLIGITCSIEYDPNRNSNIATIYNFFDNDFNYIISAKNLKVGDILKSGVFSQPKLGHSLPIYQIPVGAYIHNLKLRNSKFAKISRAAGTFSEIKEKKLNFALIKVSSGKFIWVPSKNYATIGIVSNGFNFLFKELTKAGQSRWLNRRPTVRGVAMNPIDHPHGGGEGKKSGKKKSPWGKFNFLNIHFIEAVFIIKQIIIRKQSLVQIKQ